MQSTFEMIGQMVCYVNGLRAGVVESVSNLPVSELGVPQYSLTLRRFNGETIHISQVLDRPLVIPVDFYESRVSEMLQYGLSQDDYSGIRVKSAIKGKLICPECKERLRHPEDAWCRVCINQQVMEDAALDPPYNRDNYWPDYDQGMFDA